MVGWSSPGVGGTTVGWFSQSKSTSSAPHRKPCILVAGHNEAREPLLHIAQEIRERSVAVDCYFNSHVDVLAASDTALADASFLLLGLSRASREVSSIEYKRESSLFERIHSKHAQLPCGVLRDTSGFVSAHYLARYGSIVRIVFSDERQPCPDVFDKVMQLTLLDPHVKVGLVADSIIGYLNPAKASMRT